MRQPLTIIVTFFCLLAFSTSAWAADVIDPKPFDGLLKRYVDKKGRVDYAGLKASPEDSKILNDFTAAVGAAKVEGSDKAKLAFYINAYNAHVLKAVVDRYPITSVMKVKGFFKEIKHPVAGKQMTLDALENTVIRKEFKEARIHFVLVCAAKSCPPLQRDAATEANLEKLLEGAAKSFIPKATKVTANKIVTSSLFDWFKDDFIAADGKSVRHYLATYQPAKAKQILNEEAKIEFAPYSWKLNKQPAKKADPPASQPVSSDK